MIKKCLASVFVLAMLFSFESSALMWNRSSEQPKSCHFDFYVFPIYKNNDGYFMPLKSNMDGLRLLKVSDPFANQENLEALWNVYTTFLNWKAVAQSEKDLEAAWNVMEKAELVDFIVFLDCDWAGYYKDSRSTKPLIISNENLKEAVKGTTPYFDWSKPKTEGLKTTGIAFRTTHEKAVAFEKDVFQALKIAFKKREAAFKKSDL